MSEKYTYKDVIIDPEDPRVEIGAEYCFGDIPQNLVEAANSDHYFWIRLEKVSASDGFNFKKEGGGWKSCIIRKKEPEKKYVPFDLSKEEDRNFLKGRWIKTDGDEEKITGFERDDDGVWHIKISADYLLSEDMLNLWKFDDGLPCGVLVEEDE